MSNDKQIEILREKLNNMILNEKELTKDEIVNVSKKLDKLIVIYTKKFTT